MSGPVSVADLPDVPEPPGPTGGPGSVVVTEDRIADVAGTAVRRALPKRERRTVGAWCFADHFGPVTVSPASPTAIGPHPHVGLQTVTWMVAGEQRHRDSLGSDQVIKPGQLNLMTAGAGVVHAEESRDYRGLIHGVQLWVALPESTRWSASAFQHVVDLPRLEVDATDLTVLVGTVADHRSPGRADSPLVGAELRVRPGTSVIPLDPGFEHAVMVLEGALSVAGELVRPGSLAYLGTDRDELALRTDEPTTALLLGGEPFPEPVLMWWNFVARTRQEVAEARSDWAAAATRFGAVDSGLARIDAPGLPWRQPGSDGVSSAIG
jgi:redox-sensitive bicupin YhaK (pirin superfamily)